MKHHDLDEQARETCALAALGLLPADEAAAFEAHAAECPPCRAERQSLAVAAGELAALAPLADPPSRLRDRVLTAVRDEAEKAPSVQPWKSWSPSWGETRPPALLSILADEGGWEPTATAGIEARQLFLDRTARRVTMMVRMAPGSSYPAHRHGGAEECYVVSGDLRTGDVHMHAGDWQRADAGSRHPDQVTDGGCVLLLVSSLDDTLER